MSGYFVTGTDTGVGKTRITAALLRAAAASKLRALALKPVAAGCELVDGEWHNDDARLLRAEATVLLPYAQVNPVALKLAMAPHLAAAVEGRALAAGPLVDHCREVAATPHDLALVEGAGGWLVPLNDRETLADVARELGWPVILVVGMRLGCLNHALLTAAEIANEGLTLAGWVANSAWPPMAFHDEKLATLTDRLEAPLLGVVPYLAGDPDPVAATAACLDLAPLLRR